ncbi:MAG: hypothetical protein ISN64_02925 [Rickettsia sp.]|nr:hypothetical protein [Rickettsia sp.]
MLKQKIFSLNSLDSDLSEDFIISRGNQEAFDIISFDYTKNWGCDPYKNILLLEGPESSGKTYLGKMWKKSNNAQFINTKIIPNLEFINKYHCFIIDDLDKKLDKEKNILHYFNIINESKKYLLILSNSKKKVILKDLSSRINSLKKVKIFPPDIDSIKFLIQKKFFYYSVDVREDVIEYLSKILPREYRKILQAIEKINKFALIKSRKITIPLVKEIILED